MHSHSHARIIAMPDRMRLLRDVAGHVGESMIIPLALFYGILVSVGLQYALIGALSWAYLAVAVRLVQGGRPPALLLATAALATLQAGLTTAAGSPVVFLLQPTAATYLFAVALLITVPLDRPLIQRLAHDFCPLPPEVVSSAPLRRFFQRLSLLWASVLLINASVTLGLLLTTPTTWSVPVATAASLPVAAVGMFMSYAWFRSTLRAGGYRLVWGTRPVG
ncbi:VC0807 family protein [Actinopolymorpha sp. B17G11]|uniref:VC0807 family protein n=1 Tax=unclassified Actinopolymorpha TaxID=2627063 RepID=UPI0032D930A1